MRRVQDTIQFTKEPYVEDVGPRKMWVLQFSPSGLTRICSLLKPTMFNFCYDFVKSTVKAFASLLYPNPIFTKVLKFKFIEVFIMTPRRSLLKVACWTLEWYSLCLKICICVSGFVLEDLSMLFLLFDAWLCMT